MKDPQLAAEYSAAMRRYALAPGEAHLELAYEIGRSAMAVGLGVVELTSSHHLALDGLLAEPGPDVDPKELVTRAAEFLVEALSPFEMTLRGYRQAIEGLEQEVEERKHAEEQLRTAHEELEKRVQERTAELSRANRDLRESEDRFRSLVASVRDYAIFMLDPAGHVVSWNIGAERLKGYPAGEVLGKHVSLFYTDDDRRAERPEQSLTIAATEGSFEEQGWRVRKGGSRFWADVVITPLRAGDGSLQGFTKVTRDITERRKAEEALQSANAELRQANDAKDRFVAVLSHELRNPLAPIRNSLYILEHASPSDDQGRRALTVIGRQVEQLTRLVDDLLDLTRISQNKFRLEFALLELNELVQRTVEDHRLLFERSGVAIEVTLAPERMNVNADGTRLAQVIGNLLHNAAKFTSRGGRARVSVFADPTRPQVMVSVSDDGIGIPLELLGHLFQPFMQADTSLDRSKGGLGLGLALVRGLVELHGGQVDVHTDGPGQGTEFVIRLPLAVGSVVAREAKPPIARRSGRRVLIIEDNVDAADSLREALEFGQHEVEVAYNGPEGLARAREFRPEVVLCDIGLPGMDGYEVARTFHADESLKSIFLVALSGYALPEDVQRAAQAGFARHLAKPPSLEKVERLLAEIAERRAEPSH